MNDMTKRIRYVGSMLLSQPQLINTSWPPGPAPSLQLLDSPVCEIPAGHCHQGLSSRSAHGMEKDMVWHHHNTPVLWAGQSPEELWAVRWSLCLCSSLGVCKSLPLCPTLTPVQGRQQQQTAQVMFTTNVRQNWVWLMKQSLQQKQAAFNSALLNQVT